MFQIYGFVMLAVVSLAYPGLLLLTVPLGIIWLDHLRRMVARLRAARDAYLAHEAELARLKTLRSL